MTLYPNASFESSAFLQSPPSWWQPTMPVAFADLEVELAAARAGTAVADGSMFAALEMSGPDRHDFLNRLLTNTVPTVPGEGCQAYYLSVMGRPLVQFFVFEQGSGVSGAPESVSQGGSTLLICPASQREAAYSELDKMHFGEKLRIKHLDLTGLLLFGASTKAGCHLTSSDGSLVAQFDYFSCPHQLWLQTPEDATRLLAGWGRTPIGAQALEVLRIEACSPTPGDYFEKTLFLEIARPDCYSETKGCYPGQEVVARTLHRGHINRHLQLLTVTPPSVPLKGETATPPSAPLERGTTEGAMPARDTRLLQGDKEVGFVAGAVRSVGQVLILAYLRREVDEPGTTLLLQGSGQKAQVV